MSRLLFSGLFAGSGQIGLEAVSRGAAKAFFIENAKTRRPVYRTISVLPNLRMRTLLQTDDIGTSYAEGKYRFDLIFMDPPYKKGTEKEVLFKVIPHW